MIGWNDLETGLDVVGFAQRRLGFEPDELQTQVLRSRSKRLLLNCSRQWGKSSVAAIAALYRAWFRPGSLVVVTGPSGRQAGGFVDKVREFVGVGSGNRVRADLEGVFGGGTADAAGQHVPAGVYVRVCAGFRRVV